MFGGRSGATILAACFGACAPAPIVLDVPFTEADASALIGVERGGRLELIAVEALDQRRAIATLEGLDEGSSARITALLYPTPLEALGLAEGPVPLAEAGARSRPLPAGPRAIVELELGARARAWRDVRGAQGPLASARIEDDTPPTCPARTPMVFELGARGRAVSLVVDADGARLAAPAEEAPPGTDFFRLDVGGTRREARRPELAGFTVSSQARSRDGRHYLFGTERGTPVGWVGSYARGFQRLEDRPGAAARHGIVRVVPAAAEDDPTAVFVLTERGHLLRLDAGGWSVLDDRALSGVGHFGGLAVAAADEVWFSPGSGVGLFRWTPEGTTREPTDVDAELDRLSDRIRALAFAPGLGVYAGTAQGTLLGRGDERWRVVTRLPFAEQAIHALTPSEGTLWISGRYGMVYELHARGLCPEPTPLGSNVTVLDLVPFRGGMLAAGRRTDGDVDHLIAGVVFLGAPPLDP